MLFIDDIINRRKKILAVARRMTYMLHFIPREKCGEV
jgi:hypothetical protein